MRSSKVANTNNDTALSDLHTPNSANLQNSARILKHGIESARSLQTLYDKLQKNRAGGAPTHEEQDLLRAMVVFAGAAMDATVKRIIADCLPVLIQRNEQSRGEASKFLSRNILKKLDDDKTLQVLARALLSPEPHSELTDQIIRKATGDSLQSYDELCKAARLLGVSEHDIPKKDLVEAIAVRNRIIHEMDVTEATRPGEKRRQQRKRDEMRAHAKALSVAANYFIVEVDKLLS